MCDAVKLVLRGKCIIVNAWVTTEERSQNLNPYIFVYLGCITKCHGLGRKQ
jgi:hypothetical protein